MGREEGFSEEEKRSVNQGKTQIFLEKDTIDYGELLLFEGEYQGKGREWKVDAGV